MFEKKRRVAMWFSNKASNLITNKLMRCTLSESIMGPYTKVNPLGPCWPGSHNTLLFHPIFWCHPQYIYTHTQIYTYTYEYSYVERNTYNISIIYLTLLPSLTYILRSHNSPLSHGSTVLSRDIDLRSVLFDMWTL